MLKEAAQAAETHSLTFTKAGTLMAETTPSAHADMTKVTGGDKFDMAKWTQLPALTFEDLKVGDVFRAPGRTLTDAHTSEFQAISGDNHPRHYNAEYAKSIGLKAPLVQPLQVLALSAPGAGLFTHYVGPSIVGFTETSCKFLVDSFAGDTLYAALEITSLTPDGDKGVVMMAITIFNQRSELVLSGTQKFLLKRSA